MKYLSVCQIAKQWNISPRSVRNYCAQGKISGAFLTGKTWNIPSSALQPIRKTRFDKGIIHVKIQEKKHIAIIGGGISGVFTAIRVKEKHPLYQVSIFERNDKLLKKIYATGNGKCNFANVGSFKDKYNHDDFVTDIIKSFNARSIISYFASIGIAHKNIGDLVYPYSESAETVALMLLKKVESLHIEGHLSEQVKEYSYHELTTDKGVYHFDELVISCGGKAAPQLGTDGNFITILKRHGYALVEARPSLCPIKIKENVKSLDGLRVKCKISLLVDDKLVHEEEGELLFKKDGLSGIVIFNMTHFINRQKSFQKVNICVDFAPKSGLISPSQYLEYLHPRLAHYLYGNHLDIHHTCFTFSDFYDFVNSQVTSGGLSLIEVNSFLQSQRENNVYFTGEVIDVDAVCGGYNIMWALASAEKISHNL